MQHMFERAKVAMPATRSMILRIIVYLNISHTLWLIVTVWTLTCGSLLSVLQME